MRSRTVGSSVGEERKNTEVIPSDPVLPHAQREEYLKTPALENVMDLVSTPYVAKVLQLYDLLLHTYLSYICFLVPLYL